MALERPEIDKPEGDIPFELGIDDIVVGEGDEATKGTKVSVHYVGVAFSTGEEFDASWNRGQPFEFKLGQGQVIPGWDEGVQGMKVGGRRKLTIPSAMAYGARGAGGAIKPHEPLVFVVDLLSVDCLERLLAADEGAQALVLLAAGRASLQVGAQPWKRSVGVCAGDLELDVAVQLVEALVAADLGPGGAKEAAECLLQVRALRHVVSSSSESGWRPQLSRCLRSFRRASCRVL